ncbi:hypothetical protein DHEL01_v210155 [Diaporthe helianthi]|uniref:Uncharacterized protein n=1 Tax=Diaporthe helianthi TaxID=158607 RepID=A0A2P5HMG3_DIAHE|nr:hypothetical protein DHEL01_v210155 [Diaporthe helianthi]
MQLSPQTTMAEMESRLDGVETHANAALALSIIVLIEQILMAIFMCLARQKLRAFHNQSADTERGLELQDTSRGVSVKAASRRQAQDPPLAAPAPARSRQPVGPSPDEALGRPVAAYETGQVHRGEADDYYNPSPISRRPTYALDSGLGEQTNGVDYTKQRRSKRYEEPHNTNVNDAHYGRKGNRFAHGT